MNNQRIVVVGGCGFIGSHVVDKLVEAGHEVTVYDKIPPWPGMIDKAEYVYGDVLDKGQLELVLTDKDVVFHLAAMSNTFQCVQFPERAVELNCGGTVGVLTAAQRVGVRRVVIAGSSLISGLLVDSSIPDVIDVQKSKHLYVTTKLFQEMVARDFHDMFGLPYTVLRYGICYGPRMTQGVVADIFIRRAMDGKPLVLHGGGKQWRQYMYVEDLADAHVLALDEKACNKTYTVAPDEKVSIMDMALAIQSVIPGTEIEVGNPRSHDVDVQVMSSDLIREELGWEPKVGLEEGIRQTVEWYRR